MDWGVRAPAVVVAAPAGAAGAGAVALQVSLPVIGEDVMLAGDDAGWINGQAIMANGGNAFGL